MRYHFPVVTSELVIVVIPLDSNSKYSLPDKLITLIMYDVFDDVFPTIKILCLEFAESVIVSRYTYICPYTTDCSLPDIGVHSSAHDADDECDALKALEPLSVHENEPLCVVV